MGHVLIVDVVFVRIRGCETDIIINRKTRAFQNEENLPPQF